SGNWIFAGGVNRKPSGGCKKLTFGTGTGIGTLPVIGSSIVITTSFFASPSSEKLSDSTLVCQSMFTLSAGCGSGIGTSGPKYAVLVSGAGPGSTKNTYPHSEANP